MLGVKLNFKGKSAGCYDLWKHTTYSWCNNPVRYNCTSSHSILRSIQLLKRSTMIT